jgi:DNA-binding NarL/FixJ family response regulator
LLYCSSYDDDSTLNFIMKYNIAFISPDPNMQVKVSTYFDHSRKFSCTLVVKDAVNFLKYYREFLEIRIVLLHCPDPNINYLHLIPDILERDSGIETILLSNIQEENWITQAFRFGASGHLQDNIPLPNLENILLQHLRNESVAISPEIMKQLIGYFSPKRKNKSLSKEQTESNLKEQIIRDLLKEGQSYLEIARRLDISINGVRYHVKNIYKKYKVNNRAELIRFAAGQH